jgi:hypothetical protein
VGVRRGEREVLLHQLEERKWLDRQGVVQGGDARKLELGLPEMPLRDEADHARPYSIGDANRDHRSALASLVQWLGV